MNTTHPRSISVIKFGPDNVLFIGDSRTATLFAYPLGPAAPATASRPYNVYALDQTIADLLGAPLQDIAVRHLAIHPVTKEAFVAVHRGHGDAQLPVIVRVNQDGEVRPLDLEATPHESFALPNPVGPEVRLWNDVVARSLAITAIECVNGEVFVAGMSNADFASTLYRVPYPFRGDVQASSIEMYHAVHAQNETRAPIQAMTVLDLAGEPHVLAAYTCTPLVTIPVAALRDGAHVQGKTIAELGYGDMPMDMVRFQSTDRSGQQQDQVLITQKCRSAVLLSVDAIARRNQEPGMTAPAHGIVAPEHAPMPLAGVIHVGDQDAQYLTGLRRDMETGRLHLLSFRKGLYFRVGDFVSEYMLPGYPFEQQPPHFKHFYGMMQADEGHR